MPTFITQKMRDEHPFMFAEDKCIDRHYCTRQVPMKVLTMGFARTGTVSMRRALMELGIPCYHFGNLFTSHRDSDMWVEAFEAKYRDGTAVLDRKFWDGLLGHVSAVSDFPAICFAEELIAAYPEAKVIHWERDEDRWFESFNTSIVRDYRHPAAVLLSYMDPTGLGRLRILQTLQTECVFMANSREQLRENARQAYRDHNATVKRLMRHRPENFLEYKMGAGWDPICKILDMKIPETPFPHVNDKKAMEEMKPLFRIKMFDRLFWGLAGGVWRILLFVLAYRLARRSGLVSMLLSQLSALGNWMARK